MIKVAPNVKGLIFDCDGTLADSMPGHFAAWRDAFADFNIPYDPNMLRSFSGMTTREIVRHLHDVCGYNFDQEEFIRVREQYSTLVLRTLKPEPILPVVNIVNEYYKILPMAVASGGIREHVIYTLETLGIKEKFNAIVTADDPVKPKPSPEIFLYAAEQINVAPEFCQVFEDGDPGIVGAKAANMIVTDVRLYL